MKTKSQGDLNGFLDAGSHIQGDLHFEDTFRIDGRLTGKAISNGDLVVGERGQVEAEVHVGRIFVSGTVRGSVKARGRIEITATGRVFADLQTPSLVVEDGAVVHGRCTMVREKTRSESHSPQAVVARMPLPKDS
jgi:cytoskeletal protein CcmA (bactofilin family)